MTPVPQINRELTSINIQKNDKRFKVQRTKGNGGDSFDKESSVIYNVDLNSNQSTVKK